MVYYLNCVSVMTYNQPRLTFRENICEKCFLIFAPICASLERENNFLRQLLKKRSTIILLIVIFTSAIIDRGNRISPVCLCVCPSGFVRATLCTTSTAQDTMIATIALYLLGCLSWLYHPKMDFWDAGGVSMLERFHSSKHWDCKFLL